MESRKGPGGRPEVRRTFVAVFPPEAVRREVAAALPALVDRYPGLRPVRPATLHLTLRFLGDLSAADRVAAGEVLAGLATGVRPFRVHLAGLGTFPPRRRPKVVWLGVEQGANRLVALARSLERGLAAAGFPPADAPFHPHLTLGRFREPSRDPAGLPEFPPMPAFPAETVDLVTSDLGPRGPAYTVERSVPFTG